MKGEVSFTEDIIKEVAKEMDLDVKTVEHVYKRMMTYLHYLVSKTDSLSVSLPNMGTLYIKVHKIKKVMNKGKYKNSKLREIFKLKEIRLAEYFDKIKGGKLKRKSRHLQKEKKRTWFYKRDKTWREIEELQNEL